MNHQRKTSSPIKDVVLEAHPHLVNFLMPEVEWNYRLDLISIFNSQKELVIYKNNNATAFTFAGDTYINPQYINLYNNETVVNPRYLHPSLVQDMQHFLKKYEDFIVLKNKAKAYTTRWYMFLHKHGVSSDAAPNVMVSLPDALIKAHYNNSIWAFPSHLGSFLQAQWYESEKETHSFFSTLHLKNQLLGI